MPFSVRVNEPKKRITLVCWGEIAVEEMMEYERRYWAGPEHEGFHHIIDFQVAHLGIDVSAALTLATHATPVDLDAYSGARTAIVVANDDQQIVAETYRDARHAMCSPKIREVGVFLEIDEARAWVDAGVVTYART